MTKTLDDEEIETKIISRRSSMGIISASVATVAGVLGTRIGGASAQCSDSDSGHYADPGGHGRHCGYHPPPRHHGCTDHDSGHYADAAGHGRHCGGGHHCTDHDSGHYADPAGNGRHC